MIKNIVYRLKKDMEVAQGMSLPKDKEIEIVMDVVYIDGNMVPPQFQGLFYSFVQNNLDSLEDVTRKW
jgi:hypothetical protein